ncbi:MAG: hypothetical protein PHP25_02650 [Candidatus Moranbacteria bacterium]|nr:hypothetical protein [Candidatus Moranbacteria bacterium]
MTGPKMEKGEKQSGSDLNKDGSPAEALENIQGRIENLLSSHEEMLEDYGLAHLLEQELEGIKETTGPNPRMNPEAALAHAQGVLEALLSSFAEKNESTQNDVEKQLRQILAEIEKVTGPSDEYYKK